MLRRKHFIESEPLCISQARSEDQRSRSGVPIENRGSRSQKVSARNLAASLWRQQMQEELSFSAADGGGYSSRNDGSEFRPQIDSSINSNFTPPLKNRRSSRSFARILRSDYEEEDVITSVRDLESELTFERISRKRMEIVNFKLVHELNEAKLRVRSAINRYETERKKTKLMEEFCELLNTAMEEETDRANMLRTKLKKFQAHVEKERNMLFMAKAWREEQVQMKLMAAKLAFEEKYCQINTVTADLERFLASHPRNDDGNDIELEKFTVSSPSSILRHAGAIFSHKEDNEKE